MSQSNESDRVVVKTRQPKQLTRDKVYYFQNVVFQVGSTLFRVPRDAFNIPGTIFEAMFALPPTSNAEGASDENPIVLHVDENDFRGFLRVICGPRGQDVPDDDWLRALDLATLWTFDNIRRMAILALDRWCRSQSLKQVVLTAKKYNIASWLQIAYTQLALQSRFPFDRLTEPPAVDWETIARLLYAQQTQRTTQASRTSTFDITSHYPEPSNPSNRTCPQCGTGKLCCGFIDSSVQKIFKAEFESMKEKHSEDPALPEDRAKRKSIDAVPERPLRKKKKTVSLEELY